MDRNNKHGITQPPDTTLAVIGDMGYAMIALLMAFICTLVQEQAITVSQQFQDYVTTEASPVIAKNKMPKSQSNNSGAGVVFLDIIGEGRNLMCLLYDQRNGHRLSAKCSKVLAHLESIKPEIVQYREDRYAASYVHQQLVLIAGRVNFGLRQENPTNELSK